MWKEQIETINQREDAIKARSVQKQIQRALQKDIDGKQEREKLLDEEGR